MALQIGYLPTLYAAFNRREALVTMLDSRAGVPSWGPELLARTHYGLGSGVSAVGELPELFEEWERWSADVSESHTTYLTLINFRSPRPLSSWLTAQLAVLDAAALYLSLSPTSAGAVSARLCLRGGFTCLAAIARARGFAIPDEADPNDGIALTYEEFVDAIDRLREWISRSSGRARTRGSTSWVGGSTTRQLPTPSPAPSTRRRLCGRDLVGTPSQRSRRFGLPPAGADKPPLT